MKNSNEPPTFKCHHCAVLLYNNWEKQIHVKEHFDAKMKLHYNCVMKNCLQKFESPKAFAVHWNEHYAARAYKCQYCPRRFADAAFCAGHEVSHLDKSMTTEIGADGLNYKERRELELWGILNQLAPELERNSRNERAFVCAKCGKRNFGSKTFRKHIENHDAVNKPQTFKCKHCPVLLNCLWEKQQHHKEHFDGDKKLHYNCAVKNCLQTFESPEEFAVHWNDHYAKRPYKCQYCSKRFTDAAVCAGHEVSHLEDESLAKEIGADGLNYKERREYELWGILDQLAPELGRNSNNKPAFICAKCGSRLYGASTFQKHIEHHDDKLNTYKCKYCSVEFFSRGERRTHQATHIDVNGNIHFNCIEIDCLQKFESAIDYAAHYQEHYAKLHGCKFCPRRFEDVTVCANHEANQHLQLDINDTKNEIGADGLTYIERRECELLNYLKYLAPGPERNRKNWPAFICPICSNKIFSAKHLKDHIHDHEIPSKHRTFKCKHCPALCLSEWDRNQHQYEHFDANKNLHYNCVVKDCLQKFESPEEFAVHWNEHYAGRAYKCQYCPRRFVDAACCAGHEVSHLDNKSMAKEEFADDGLTYKERRELEMWGILDHLAPDQERNSRNARAFVCAKCGSKIFGPLSFRRHLEIHDDQLNTYKCKYCFVELCSPGDMRTHQANHIDVDGNIHFDCIESGCLQKFESATDYAAHYQEHYAKLHGCNFCPRRFKDVAVCVNHEANQHLQLDLKGTKDELGDDGLTYNERRECELMECLDYLAPGPERNKRNSLAFICPTCSNKVFTASYLKEHMNHHKEGRLQCEFCSFSANQESRFKEHMIYHIEEKSFPCDICDQKLRTQNHLNKHKKRYHSKKAHCKCQYCEDEFEDEYTYKKHIITEHGGSKKCHFCDMGFTTSLAREQHEQSIHADKLHNKCEKCGERFGKVVSLLRHSIVHDPIVQHCLDCQQEFPDEFSLLQHVKSEHKDYKGFECETCGKRFASNSEVRMHHKKMHKAPSQTNDSTALTAKEEKELKALGYMEYLAPGPERDVANKLALMCPKCDVKSFGYTRFKVHLNSHEVLHCDLCMYSTVSTYRMKQHVAQIHSDEPGEHICETCGKSFKLRNNMLKHQEVHKKRQLCKCKFCGEKFQDKYMYVQHKNNLHGGVVKCHFCDKGFSIDAIRDQHEQKEHPAKCDICGERFRNKMALFSHSVYHKRKPQNCLECHEQFQCEYDLLQHVKTHENYLGYECEFCGKRFPAKVNLRGHRKTVHKVKPIRTCKRKKTEDNKENKPTNSESEEYNGEESSESEISDAEIEEERKFNLDETTSNCNILQVCRTETSIIPLTCAIQQKLINLENSAIAWTTRFEPDLITFARLHPCRMFICILQTAESQHFMKRMYTVEKIFKISVTLAIPNTKQFRFYMLSCTNLQLKNIYNSFEQFETAIKEKTKLNEIAHYVRNSNRDLCDTMKEIISGRVVTCN